jgi:cyclopentanol dehydrogenase
MINDIKNKCGYSLADKVAVITGAASGLGAATAQLFANQGALVALIDLDEKKGTALAKQIIANDGKAIFIKADVAQESAWVALLKETISKFSKIDILVNNAAIFIAKTLENTTIEEWDLLFNVNVKSVFLGCKHTLPFLRQNQGGVIVNVSTMYTQVGAVGMAAYITAKASIKHLSKSLAAECAADNIRVNTICPGLIDTPMVRDIQTNTQLHNEFLSQILLHRAASPTEIAQAILFLASSDSSYMTGSELVIDGGYTAT